jgi:transposase
VLRQKWSRGQMEARLANLPLCLIGMEACVGAHHLSRKLKALGHDARLMPAKYVRSYSKGKKSDYRDADAIAEAVQRPTMKFVATKSANQFDLQALHRVRERLVGQRTGIINQIRAFLLEGSIAVRQGLHFLRAELPGILAKRTDVLSPRMLRVIEDLAGDWRRLDERIDGLSDEIMTLARQDKGCERLMTVPGIGPIISSAMVAASRQRRRVFQGPRLRGLARIGAEADVDRRPHDPRQRIKTWQSLSAHAVRSGRPGRLGQDQARGMGALPAQIVDRSGEATPAPLDETSCTARPDHTLGQSPLGRGSIATGQGKLQVQPCPQCRVSDGRLEKGWLVAKGHKATSGWLFNYFISGDEKRRRNR